MIRLGNVLILGDSYSTFERYIPEEYETWYCRQNYEGHYTDVCDVAQTWWAQLFDRTDATLTLNCSWSGTTVCHTGFTGDCSHKSFVGRFDKLVSDGFFEQHPIDTVFVFGGTNDAWANSPLGENMTADWKKEDLFSFLPAIFYLNHRLKTTLPNARIVCILNSDLPEAIVRGTKEACRTFQTEAVELTNISKQTGHPDVNGMRQIAEQLLAHLKKTAADA